VGQFRPVGGLALLGDGDWANRAPSPQIFGPFQNAPQKKISPRLIQISKELSRRPFVAAAIREPCDPPGNKHGAGGVHAQRRAILAHKTNPMRRRIDELSFGARVAMVVVVVAITIAVLMWDMI
jgi:hypothetical protein